MTIVVKGSKIEKSDADRIVDAIGKLCEAIDAQGEPSLSEENLNDALFIIGQKLGGLSGIYAQLEDLNFNLDRLADRLHRLAIDREADT